VSPLHGHDEAVAAFRAALDSGRLHHAWLIAGPPGVGKGLFARSAALRFLAEGAGPPPLAPRLGVERDHPAAMLFEAESHPDFRLVEREAWDRKGNLVPKHERGPGDEAGRNIRVVQIRGLIPFLGVSPSLSPRRAIVIDSVDDLEGGAANALLKNLEEPPAHTLFLLVSHAPDRLLPTIRSRCRVLRLAPLSDDAMASALRAALPDADEAEIAALIRAGEGSPGRAIAFRGLEIDALDKAMRELATSGDPANAGRVALADALAPKSAQARYEAFLARAPSLIASLARDRHGPALAHALDQWERASRLAVAARRLSLDPHSTAFELAGLIASLAEGEGKAAA
jgi:DNA polymerase III subunit delta'